MNIHTQRDLRYKYERQDKIQRDKYLTDKEYLHKLQKQLQK